LSPIAAVSLILLQIPWWLKIIRNQDTSYSHTSARPKFRVVIDIDRPITRTEAAKLFMWLDWSVLGRQADASIYDPADFIFAPPHHHDGGHGRW
jgi:hypothetical protein